MAISIKSFSPLKSEIPDYYLNSDTHQGNELMFTDTLSTLNCLILRRDYTDITKYYLLSYKTLSGYSNGTNYDYRIDLSPHIKIVHDNVFVPSTVSPASPATPKFAQVNMQTNQCEIVVYIGAVNLMTALSSYITTSTNGEKYVTSLPTITDTYKDTFNFYDHSKQSLYIGELYKNSYFPILLDNTSYPDYTLTNVVFYNSAGTAIGNDYGSGWNIQALSLYNRLLLYVVPDDAVRVAVTYKIINTPYTYNIYLKGCATNQYFYFGKVHAIESLYCTGKREKIESIKKEYVKFSNKNKPISIIKQKKYEQNVGFGLTEEQIFNIASTPALYEYSTLVPGVENITIWNIDNEEFSGINTKNISERNFVLSLTKDGEDRRYTSFLPNFYS